MHPPPRKRGRGTARSAAEGASPLKPLFGRSNDSVSSFVDFTLKVVDRDPYHGHVVRFKPLIALAITRRPIAHVVSDTVDFDP